MVYIKLVDNIVVQKQPNKDDGFIEVYDSVICGMLHDGSDNYAETNFFSPVHARTWVDVKKLQRKMIVMHEDMMQIHEREVSHIGTEVDNYSMSPDKYQEWLSYFQEIRNNDEAMHSTPDKALAALNALSHPTM